MRTLEEVFDCEHLATGTIWQPGSYHAERVLKCTQKVLQQDGFPLTTTTDVCRMCPFWQQRTPQ